MNLFQALSRLDDIVSEHATHPDDAVALRTVAAELERMGAERAAVLAVVDLANWLAELDTTGTVTLIQVCNKAREALARRWSA